jgi:predicted Zn-dependent protease
MRDPSLSLAILLALAPFAAGCAADSPAGGSRVILGSGDGAREESEAVARVREEMGLVADSGLSDYVDAAGRRVTERSPAAPPALSFHVVDRAEPNVFAVPEGHVFVTRGLLASVNSESELANLLAHEIAHVTGRDLPRRISGMPALTFGTVVMRAGLSPEPEGGRAFPGYAMGVATIGRFPLDAEATADPRGQDLAARAGFDPRDLAAALRGLDAVARASEGVPLIPGFFITHPSPEDRLGRATSRADALAPTRVSDEVADRARHLRVVDGMLLGPNPADGAFVGDRFLHHDRGYALRLPEGWTHLHSRSAVGAVSPQGDVQIVLERQGSGGDPADAARQFIDGLSGRLRLRVLRAESLRVGGRSAHRARLELETPHGPVHAELTWFAHEGAIYRLAGAERPGAVMKHQIVLRNVARSFRPITDRERTEIFEDRLRVVAAVPGETLADLSARSGNVWTLERTAALNRVEAGASLDAGLLVKVAVRVPYRGRDLGARPIAR